MTPNPVAANATPVRELRIAQLLFTRMATFIGDVSDSRDDAMLAHPLIVELVRDIECLIDIRE